MAAQTRTQVAIVGAGFAGLTAARELTRRGIDAIVLEARDRVGGRTWTIRKDGYWLDIGGQWTGPGQDRINALGKEMGVASFPTWPEGEHIQYTDGIGIRRWVGAAPDQDMETMSKVVQAIMALDQLAAEVPIDAPWNAPHAREWDSMTVQGWIDANIESPRAREQMCTAIEAVYAAEPHDVSLLHALFYARSGGGMFYLISTEGGAQADRFDGGMQLVAERVAAERSACAPLRARPPHRPGLRRRHRRGRRDQRQGGALRRHGAARAGRPHRLPAGNAAAARPPDYSRPDG